MNTMKCPKCGSNFEEINTPQGDVERCISCMGLWLDYAEFDDIKDIAEGVDIGDADIGKKYNAMDKVYCPTCANSQLIRMVDNDQPHIWFESCPTCYGRFYDAGELRDLSEITLGDFVKRLFSKERK